MRKKNWKTKMAYFLIRYKEKTFCHYASLIRRFLKLGTVEAYFSDSTRSKLYFRNYSVANHELWYKAFISCSTTWLRNFVFFFYKSEILNQTQKYWSSASSYFKKCKITINLFLSYIFYRVKVARSACYLN